MDFNDNPDEAAFRAKTRAWLKANAPDHVLSGASRLSETEIVLRGRQWQRALYDGGFAGITLPTALGGRGCSDSEDIIFHEEESRFRLPKGPYVTIGTGMALPVIGQHGNQQQIERFAESTLKGEVTWAQLFSEPSAGSDLAALRTSAVLDGKDWIVNGQKVWSTWAHHSDWGLLVTRTDPTLPKHKGLTFFLLEMTTPGVEVKPIRQISGASDFNEVFLTDVRIPDINRIGAIGEGWACCMTVLSGERVGTSLVKSSALPLLDYAADTHIGDLAAIDQESYILDLARIIAEERGASFLEARLRTMLSRGQDPGALAGMIKLAYGARLQRMCALAMEMRGLDAIAPDDADTTMHEIHRNYYWAAAMRIAGGADQVLRNQISERILNMPSEKRYDKNIPFRDIRT